MTNLAGDSKNFPCCRDMPEAAAKGVSLTTEGSGAHVLLIGTR